MEKEKSNLKISIDFQRTIGYIISMSENTNAQNKTMDTCVIRVKLMDEIECFVHFAHFKNGNLHF